MADRGVWAVTHEQRRDLVDLLAGLTDEQWNAASLCAGWRVRDVVAHLISTARMTPGLFFLGMAGSGFRFGAFTARNIARYADRSPQELVAEMRETAGRTSGPPGPPETPLSEVVVHGLDISRPLGIKREIPAEALTRVLDLYRNTQLLIGAKRRIAGLRLVASDLEWQTGAGPEVSGPAASLLQAMSGRRVALDDLTGDGLEQLTARM